MWSAGLSAGDLTAVVRCARMRSRTSASVDERLLSHVARRDTPCPGCGYNLRGLMGAVCPECGAALDLDTLLATEADFRVRRRRLVWASAATMGIGATLWLAARFSRGPGPGPSAVMLVFVFGVLAVVLVALSAIILGVDDEIHRDRIRFPRARTLPSFGRVVNGATAVHLLYSAGTGLLVVLLLLGKI